MKAYKGFKVDKDGRIYCQPSKTMQFYYEEVQTYECKEAKLCEYGFHACTLPIDVFKYYSSKYDSVEFHEVELEGVSEEHEFDSKIVGTKITIGRKITPDEMLDISIQMIMDDKEKYFPDNKPYKIRKDNKLNYLKSDGTILSEQWFDWVDYFQDGFAIVCMGKYPNFKYNFIREDGTYLTEEWYDDVWDFENSFIRVKLKDKYNFIRVDGTLVSEKWFDYAYDFDYNGFAKVKLNNYWYKLNEKGELI